MREDGDCISRKTVIEAMYKDAEAHPGHTFWVTQFEALRDIPTADVVEVVRCKDCKYSEHWYRDKRLCRLWYGEEKPSAPVDVFDDGFCNYGERREDDA